MLAHSANLSTVNLGSGSTDRDLWRDFFAQGTLACLPARLQDGAGGYSLEAPGIALSVGPTADGSEFQEPEAPAVKREAGRGLGQVMDIVERFPFVYCDTYKNVQPMIFNILKANNLTDHDAADIRYNECKIGDRYTAHTLSADTHGSRKMPRRATSRARRWKSPSIS